MEAEIVVGWRKNNNKKSWTVITFSDFRPQSPNHNHQQRISRRHEENTSNCAGIRAKSVTYFFEFHLFRLPFVCVNVSSPTLLSFYLIAIVSFVNFRYFQLFCNFYFSQSNIHKYQIFILTVLRKPSHEEMSSWQLAAKSPHSTGPLVHWRRLFNFMIDYWLLWN